MKKRYYRATLAYFNEQRAKLTLERTLAEDGFYIVEYGYDEPWPSLGFYQIINFWASARMSKENNT